MENGQLFDYNNNLFSADKIFIKIIKISYEIDYEYLFNSMKSVSYDEYCTIRKKVISTAVKNMSVSDTEVAKQKYWERIVLQLESKFNFQKHKKLQKRCRKNANKEGGL